MCYSQAHLISALPEAIVNSNDHPDSIVTIIDFQEFR